MPDTLHRFTEKYSYYYERSIKPILRGEMPYPVDWHIYPSNICNHQCVWCMFRQNGEQFDFRVTLPRAVLLRAVEDAARTDARLIHFSGGGEPLINKATLEAMTLAQRLSAERVAAGGEPMEVALSTNGRLLTPEVAAQVDNIRVSLNAGTPEQHHATNHGGDPNDEGDWHIILENIRKALPFVRRDIGLGFVVDYENYRDIVPFCAVAADLFKGEGSPQRQRFVHIRPGFYYDPEKDAKTRAVMPDALLQCQLAQHNYGKAVEIHAINSGFDNYWTPRTYHTCRAVLSGTTLRATGDFAVCQDRTDLTFGHTPNYKQGASFEEVWHSDEHKAVVARIHDGEGGELSKCPRCVWNFRNARLDAVEADTMRIALV